AGMTPSTRPPLTSIRTSRQPQKKGRRLRKFRAVETNPESNGACRECQKGCDAVAADDSPDSLPDRSGPPCGAWDRPAGSLVETSQPARSDCTRPPRPRQRATREGDAHVQLWVVDGLRVEEDGPVEERPAQLGPEVAPHCAGPLVETSQPARSDCTRSPRPGQRATREGDAHVQRRVVDVLRVEEDAPVEERPAQLGPEVVPHCAGLLVCPRGAGCLDQVEGGHTDVSDAEVLGERDHVTELREDNAVALELTDLERGQCPGTAHHAPALPRQ